MGSDLVRVRVRLFWWGGTSGRLVLVRTIDHWTYSLCEMWWSQTVDEDEAASAGVVLNPAQWHQLWSGLPVESFHLPVPLYRVSDEDDPDDREAMSEALTRPEFHLLSSIHTVVHNNLRESVLLAMDRPKSGIHRLARPFRFSIDHPPDAFARLTAEAPLPGAVYEVDLSNVRGVMIGDGNEQINRFDITVENAEFNLEHVLAREGVQRAIAEVTMNPNDESRRIRLISALTHPGWFVSWHPARLSVTDPGATQSAGFLATLLGFNVDVKVGDGNRQTNRFTYVTSCLPDAQDLLAGNEKLARAIAGLICPTQATTDTESLLHVVNEAVRGVPVDFLNGRLQALNLEPHPYMSLVHVDGAMVGEGNVQQTFIEVSAGITEADFERFAIPYEILEPVEVVPDEPFDGHDGFDWSEGRFFNQPYNPESPDHGGEYPGRGGPSLF